MVKLPRSYNVLSNMSPCLGRLLRVFLGGYGAINCTKTNRFLYASTPGALGFGVKWTDADDLPGDSARKSVWRLGFSDSTFSKYGSRVRQEDLGFVAVWRADYYSIRLVAVKELKKLGLN